MLGAALEKSATYVNGDETADISNSIRISSNRNEINNRFPSLGFHINTAGLPFFEVLLTVDRDLFDPLHAADRTPDNFYSSRQDSGLIEAEDRKGIYLVPPVVLRAFSQSPSRTGYIYYTLIAYNSSLGGNPILAHTPEQLSQDAPSVIVANDFSGTTLSHVLGAAVENLRTVGPGGRVLALASNRHTASLTNGHMTRPLELIRPFYDPADPATALMSQNNAFSIEREEWFAGVPNTQLFPHSAICQLKMTASDGSRYQGTGFYIGTNRVLTCAHNLTGMSSVTIIPGRNGLSEKPYGEVSVNSTSWRMAPGYSGSGDWDNDLAVIDNVPLAAPGGQYFRFLNATPSDQMPIVACGYSAGSRRVPELDEIIDGDMQHLHGGYVREQSNLEVIEYPILTLMGASGSPVYNLSSASGELEALICAVHVSGEPAASGLNRGCFITPNKIDWIEGRSTSKSSGLVNMMSDSPQTTIHAPYPEEGEDDAYSGMKVPPGNEIVSDNNNDSDFEYDDGYGDDNSAANSKDEVTDHSINIEKNDDYGDDDFGIRASQPELPVDQPKPGIRNDDDDYDDGMDKVEGMSYQPLDRPFDEPSTAPGQASAKTELTDDAKLNIIEYIVQFESGSARFGAMNLDGEYRGRFGTDNPYYQKAHVGLSYGMIQFTQDSGNLGRLLTLMYERDSEFFEHVFGAHWNELLQVTNAQGPGSLNVEGGRSVRVQPVAGHDLWEDFWVSRFRDAAIHVPFQAAQNQLAAETFLDPVVPYSRWLGLNTERGIAMLFDRAVQMGVSGGMKFIVNTVGPVKTDAHRAESLQALGHETLEDFQRSHPGVTVDGDWGKQSHAAMVGALRGLGAASPIEIPDYAESLDMIVHVANGRSWAHRVISLRNDVNLSDDYFA